MPETRVRHARTTDIPAGNTHHLSHDEHSAFKRWHSGVVRSRPIALQSKNAQTLHRSSSAGKLSCFIVKSTTERDDLRRIARVVEAILTETGQAS
jgi:hypothetical protein